MNAPSESDPASKPHLSNSEKDMIQQVAAKASRRIQAQQRRKSIWYGLGLFGVVGWSVAIPSLAGIFLGIWMDQHISSPYSWTLMLLVLGVGIGCLNAWYWVQKESEEE
jgi:ATP synthase protein I